MMKSFQDGPGERADTLFRAAKCLSDPLNGVEHADLWMIQAWTLMAFYMLIISKRNAAYAYCGKYIFLETPFWLIHPLPPLFPPLLTWIYVFF